MPALANSARREELVRIVQASPWFMSALAAVNALNLRSWCIGAGAVRNLVWDHLHGYEKPSELSDIDVAYFDSRSTEQGKDAELQDRLRIIDPNVPWEVTNQAFVHTWFESYFGHPVPPLESIEEAVGSWPEYATSVGVLLTEHGTIEVISPHGLEDLFALRVRRNPVRVSVETYRQRVEQKQYSRRWPRVSVELT
jgi:uncharacterized protein